MIPHQHRARPRGRPLGRPARPMGAPAANPPRSPRPQLLHPPRHARRRHRHLHPRSVLRVRPPGRRRRRHYPLRRPRRDGVPQPVPGAHRVHQVRGGLRAGLGRGHRGRVQAAGAALPGGPPLLVPTVHPRVGRQRLPVAGACARARRRGADAEARACVRAGQAVLGLCVAPSAAALFAKGHDRMQYPPS